MIFAIKNTFRLKNPKILRPKVTKILKIWLKKSFVNLDPDYYCFDFVSSLNQYLLITQPLPNQLPKNDHLAIFPNFEPKSLTIFRYLRCDVIRLGLRSCEHVEDCTVETAVNAVERNGGWTAAFGLWDLIKGGKIISALKKCYITNKNIQVMSSVSERRSQSYQTFIFVKQRFFPFFAIKLGHLKVQTKFSWATNTQT